MTRTISTVEPFGVTIVKHLCRYKHQNLMRSRPLNGEGPVSVRLSTCKAWSVCFLLSEFRLPRAIFEKITWNCVGAQVLLLRGLVIMSLVNVVCN